MEQVLLKDNSMSNEVSDAFYFGKRERKVKNVNFIK
jgi:hypothetical protein